MREPTRGHGLEIRSTVLRGGERFVRAGDAAADTHRDLEDSPEDPSEPAVSVLVELGTGRGACTRVHMDERGVEGLTIARLRQAAQVLLQTADELEDSLLH